MAPCKQLAGLLLLGYCGVWLRQSEARQVVLLDTTRTDSLNWRTHSKGEVESARRGWREGSYYADSNNEVVRVYTVCNVAVTSVDNWLRTSYIAPSPANRLYIDITFTIRKCLKYPNPSRLQQCKESFKLLYREVDSELPADDNEWSDELYHHIDVIAADRVFVDVNEAAFNAETRSVPITHGRGVYFAFRDQGACATLLSIRIYYVTCPTVVSSFAIFDETPAGPDVTSIVQRDGRCVDNAAPVGPSASTDAGTKLPSYLCKADGEWYFLSGGCQCMPGYETSMQNGTTYCSACPQHTYKWPVSSTEPCRACPANSDTVDGASTVCRCDDGFYRGIHDDPATSPCTGPPSAVVNLTVTHRDQSTVNLTWLQPVELGGRNDLTYRVDCVGCDDKVTFSPTNIRLNVTRVSIMGLSPGVQYKFIVHAENGVSSVINSRNSAAEIFASTETTVPTKIRNLRITSVGSDHMTLTWDAQKRPRLNVDMYEVRHWTANDVTSDAVNYTTWPNLTLTHLTQGTKYSFKVRGHSNKGWGEYSDVVDATTGHIARYQADSPVGIIVGSAVAVVICMIIVAVMIFIFVKRNNRCPHDKHIIDYDDVRLHGTLQCQPGVDGTLVIDSRVTIPLFPKSTISEHNYSRTYVDPHTYEDPSLAVREFTKEIDASFITIESVIGSGEFGEVCKGRLKLTGKSELIVAIKTLKPGASEKNRLDFLTEASIMGQFNDPNVIYLQGVVTRCHPTMIVTEYMENGSLDMFLRNNDGRFTIVQLIGLCRDIASGMCYLSSMGYVHRDLAARNILVDSNMTCKVSDFGLSREVEIDSSGGVYTTKGGKIPVRWTAPEAITYRKFTSASDVWSFGVVTWEVMSYGERPYWHWTNQDVIKAVEKGYRLPPPMECPETLYQLMLDCWHDERCNRPKFVTILRTLDKLMEFPQLLDEPARTRPENIPCNIVSSIAAMSAVEPQQQQLQLQQHQLQMFAVDQSSQLSTSNTSFQQYNSVNDWLTDIKMERYVDNFARCGYVTMEKVATITHRDLVTLGVSLVGHQKKILNSVQVLRLEIQQQSTLAGNNPPLLA